VFALESQDVIFDKGCLLWFHNFENPPTPDPGFNEKKITKLGHASRGKYLSRRPDSQSSPFDEAAIDDETSIKEDDIESEFSVSKAVSGIGPVTDDEHESQNSSGDERGARGRSRSGKLTPPQKRSLGNRAKVAIKRVIIRSNSSPKTKKRIVAKEKQKEIGAEGKQKEIGAGTSRGRWWQWGIIGSSMRRAAVWVNEVS
jgi:hypothetical protein